MEILKTILQRQRLFLVGLDGCFVVLSESSRDAIKKLMEINKREENIVGNIWQRVNSIRTQRLLTS